MDLLPMCDFITWSFGKKKKSGSQSYADIPNVDILLHNIKKVTDLIRKICKYWEAVKLTVVDTSFSEF